MPYYNLMRDSDGIVKQSNINKNGISIPFSSSAYWANENGWNDSSKLIKGVVNIDMKEKNTDGTYKNAIQSIVDEYKETLKELGAKEVNVRICTIPEIGSELPNTLTESEKNDIRNPGKIGGYWVGCANPNNKNNVWRTWQTGAAEWGNYSDYAGIRPIIEIF